jgi:ABC-type bacteriocin/lantibiotic exporter with double-glycine peptidase domain
LKLDDLVRAATSRVETVRVVRTAINPLLWLVGLVTPLALVGAVLIGDLWMRIALLVLAFLPVIFTIAAYFMYMFRDPDRLQSEEYRLRQSALQLLVAKDSGAKVVDAATQIARIENLLGGFGDGEEK